MQKFLALAFTEKLLFVRAWLMLGWFRAALLLLPFKRLTRGLRHQPGPDTLDSMAASQLAEAKRIGYLVAAAARVTPWQSLCLVQVLVVQRLLQRRGIAGQFFLGVNRGEASTNAPAGLSAHAWLQCANEIVSGESGHEEHTVVSAFSWGAAGG